MCVFQQKIITSFFSMNDVVVELISDFFIIKIPLSPSRDSFTCTQVFFSHRSVNKWNKRRKTKFRMFAVNLYSLSFEQPCSTSISETQELCQKLRTLEITMESASTLQKNHVCFIGTSSTVPRGTLVICQDKHGYNVGYSVNGESWHVYGLEANFYSVLSRLQSGSAFIIQHVNERNVCVSVENNSTFLHD